MKRQENAERAPHGKDLLPPPARLSARFYNQPGNIDKAKMDQAAKGKSALASGDFSSAISHYTNAILSSPQAVDYYVQRSTAYTRSSPPNHQAALKDAEIAVVLANKRAKRELIASAQLRRAIALFGLERWADSKQCLQWVKKLNDKEKSLPIWEAKADGKLKALPEGDKRAEVAVKETPDAAIPKLDQSDKAEAAKTHETGISQPVAGNSTSTTASAPAPRTQGVQTPASKIRYDWYQTSDIVTVTLLAKGVSEKQATVHIGSTSVEMTFPLSTGSDYDFTLDPLYSSIDPDASSFKIMPTKVEFRLKKATPGSKWASIEGQAASASTSQPEDGSKEETPITKPAASGPAYPTSSKSGPKNWDKLADDLTAKKKKQEGEKEGEGEVEDDGPVLDDDEEGDPVNGFFKKLFKNADPDTKRAMMKSYQESNGTALSTNWAEVGKGKVETTPPDGMEAKKWDA